jgi:hypothetical protein
LTCFHHVLQASLTTPSADLLVLFNAFARRIMPHFNLTVNKRAARFAPCAGFAHETPPGKVA